MFWRVPRRQYEAKKGRKNKRAFQKIVTNDEKPGIIAYLGKEPVGWCAVAPRDIYIGLERSRILKPIDDKPVWSVSCLFVRKDYRRKGVSSVLLRAAVEFAVRSGAKIVEGYIQYQRDTIRRALQWAGSLLITIAAVLFLVAFFYEPNLTGLLCACYNEGNIPGCCRRVASPVEYCESASSFSGK